ncbi:hypothetical protein AAHA92_02717 [Salvia divinorum]|uniref:Uncharacterized protein n=1 Tax=Salvia divinorum TaxID=28513 RepID=A0ABD1IFM7_SALDI
MPEIGLRRREKFNARNPPQKLPMGSAARRNLPYGSAWRSAVRAANSTRAPLSLPLKKYSTTLLTSCITIAWLAKTGGEYTMIKDQENVPFMLRLCGDTQFRIQRLPLEARAFEGYRRFRI